MIFIDNLQKFFFNTKIQTNLNDNRTNLILIFQLSKLVYNINKNKIYRKNTIEH